MSVSPLIVHTELPDLPQIFSLFDASIQYQEKNGYPVWKNYDQKALVNDIESRNQYKVMLEGEMAIVFSVCYADKIIWRARENGNAVYLHRIVVNPTFKGQKLFGLILDWAIHHAKRKSLEFIRMDTWASNSNIIDYYKNFGFSFVENYTTPDTPELPVHNRNLSLTLLEYPL